MINLSLSYEYKERQKSWRIEDPSREGNRNWPTRKAAAATPKPTARTDVIFLWNSGQEKRETTGESDYLSYAPRAAEE
jgi:hypothetical protein